MNNNPSPWRKIRYTGYIIIISVLCVVLAGLYLDRQSRTTIIIDINGTIYEINTHASTVAGALQDANILIDEADQISPPLQTPLDDNMTILVDKAHQLVLDVDGEVQRVYTHQSDPLEILTEQNIPFEENDLLFVNHRAVATTSDFGSFQPIRHIGIIHSKRYTIREDERVIVEGRSTARTVGEVLAEAGINLFVADQISPVPATPLRDGITIDILRSSPVTIEVDNTIMHTRAIGETVGDILNFAGFPLSGQDYALPDVQTTFTANMSIEVVRVFEMIERQRESVPYETLSYPDPSLPIGTTHILQEGREGIQETILRIRRENGDIVSETAQSPWLIVPPITQIIVYGTESE